MAATLPTVSLSKETLDQITPALHSMRDSLKNQTRLLTDTFNLQTNELRAAERRRNLAQSQADGQAAALAAAAATPASPAAAGGTGGGGIGGLGIAGLAGLGGLAMGAMKGVGGLALLGVAIPTFFGGLLAGSETLGWMQETKGMDFEGLKTASLGFSEVIKVIQNYTKRITIGRVLDINLDEKSDIHRVTNQWNGVGAIKYEFVENTTNVFSDGDHGAYVMSTLAAFGLAGSSISVPVASPKMPK